MNIQNHRQIGESAVAYRHRRREVAKLIGHYLATGTPATQSNKMRDVDGVRQAYIYVNGPHRSHLPHEVKFTGTVLGPAGVPRAHTWTVMHPGTLVKA